MTTPTDLAQALRRAERKLSAYVGVCSGDTELTNTILPMCREAIAAYESRAQPETWPVELRAIGFNDAAAVIGYMDDIDAEVARITGDEGEDSSLQVLRRMPDYQPAQPASVSDESRDRIKRLLWMIEGHQYGLQFGDGAVREGRKFTQDENRTIKEALWIALASAQSASVAAGWAMVPRGPTNDMVLAGIAAWSSQHANAIDIWHAMLAAAPQPANGEEHGTD